MEKKFSCVAQCVISTLELPVNEVVASAPRKFLRDSTRLLYLKQNVLARVDDRLKRANVVQSRLSILSHGVAMPDYYNDGVVGTSMTPLRCVWQAYIRQHSFHSVLGYNAHHFFANTISQPCTVYHPQL